MRGKALKNILKKITRLKFKLGDASALEMFAREGDWQAYVYGKRVRRLEAWEIEPSYKNNFLKLIPKTNYRITDSVKEVKKRSNWNKFDLLVIDAPQNCYGLKRRYCEHFDFIGMAPKLLKSEGFIIFNVNLKPYDLNLYSDWAKRRRLFYNVSQRRISLKWLKKFYQELFRKSGCKTNYVLTQIRRDNVHNNAYLFAYYLEKT